jgi:hypothetical protein
MIASAYSYACLRAYAQPIARPANFVAIHNLAERKTIVGLLDLQYRLRRRGIGVGFKRLLFDIATSIGEMRPDLLLDLRDFTTGEVIEAALEVVTGDDADALGLKLRGRETSRDRPRRDDPCRGSRRRQSRNRRA